MTPALKAQAGGVLRPGLAGLATPSRDTASMAATNLDIVRSIHADWERGDFSSTEWAHPEIEYEHADGPPPARWTGLQGLSDGYREWLAGWEEIRVFADEY